MSPSLTSVRQRPLSAGRIPSGPTTHLPGPQAPATTRRAVTLWQTSLLRLTRTCRGVRGDDGVRAAGAPPHRLSAMAGRLMPGVQQVPAGPVAAAAGLRADPAMRHVGMPLALIAAALADGRAGPHQQPGGAEVTPCRAAEDRGG